MQASRTFRLEVRDAWYPQIPSKRGLNVVDLWSVRDGTHGAEAPQQGTDADSEKRASTRTSPPALSLSIRRSAGSTTVVIEVMSFRRLKIVNNRPRRFG